MNASVITDPSLFVYLLISIIVYAMVGAATRRGIEAQPRTPLPAPWAPTPFGFSLIWIIAFIFISFAACYGQKTDLVCANPMLFGFTMLLVLIWSHVTYRSINLVASYIVSLVLAVTLSVWGVLLAQRTVEGALFLLPVIIWSWIAAFLSYQKAKFVNEEIEE